MFVYRSIIIFSTSIVVELTQNLIRNKFVLRKMAEPQTVDEFVAGPKAKLFY